MLAGYPFSRTNDGFSRARQLRGDKRASTLSENYEVFKSLYSHKNSRNKRNLSSYKAVNNVEIWAVEKGLKYVFI